MSLECGDETATEACDPACPEDAVRAETDFAGVEAVFFARDAGDFGGVFPGQEVFAEDAALE